MWHSVCSKPEHKHKVAGGGSNSSQAARKTRFRNGCSVRTAGEAVCSRRPMEGDGAHCYAGGVGLRDGLDANRAQHRGAARQTLRCRCSPVAQAPGGTVGSRPALQLRGNAAKAWRQSGKRSVGAVSTHTHVMLLARVLLMTRLRERADPTARARLERGEPQASAHSLQPAPDAVAMEPLLALPGRRLARARPGLAWRQLNPRPFVRAEATW